MAGPNYVLDKGFNLSNSGAAQSIYRFVKFNWDIVMSLARTR